MYKQNRFITYAINVLRNRNIKQIVNSFLFLLSSKVSPLTPHSPVMATIGITDKCNLNCKMCARRDPNTNNLLGEMNFEQFKYFLAQMPYINRLTPVGLGEPLMHQDIFKMIAYAKTKNIEIYLITNGMLLTDRAAEKLIKLGVDKISVSIDGAKIDTIERIRQGVKYDVLINNIQKLVKKRDASKSQMKIAFTPTLSPENINEFLEIIQLANELGVDSVEAQEVQFSFNPEMTEDIALRMHSDSEKKVFKEILCNGKRIGEKNGIPVSIPRLNQHKKWSRCYEPWTILTVMSKGQVKPCCAVHDVSLGNAFENPISEIWNGRNFIEWRQRMRSASPPEQCLKCHFF